MTIPKYIKCLIELDPYEVVTAELDNFSAYECLKVPKHISEQIDKMSNQDQHIVDELNETYLNTLKYGCDMETELNKTYDYCIQELSEKGTEEMISE